jgi:hypothetical protein
MNGGDQTKSRWDYCKLGLRCTTTFAVDYARPS